MRREFWICLIIVLCDWVFVESFNLNLCLHCRMPALLHSDRARLHTTAPPNHSASKRGEHPNQRPDTTRHWPALSVPSNGFSSCQQSNSACAGLVSDFNRSHFPVDCLTIEHSESADYNLHHNYNNIQQCDFNDVTGPFVLQPIVCIVACYKLQCGIE